MSKPKIKLPLSKQINLPFDQYVAAFLQRNKEYRTWKTSKDVVDNFTPVSLKLQQMLRGMRQGASNSYEEAGRLALQEKLGNYDILSAISTIIASLAKGSKFTENNQNKDVLKVLQNPQDKTFASKLPHLKGWAGKDKDQQVRPENILQVAICCWNFFLDERAKAIQKGPQTDNTNVDANVENTNNESNNEISPNPESTPENLPKKSFKDKLKNKLKDAAVALATKAGGTTVSKESKNFDELISNLTLIFEEIAEDTEDTEDVVANEPRNLDQLRSFDKNFKQNLLPQYNNFIKDGPNSKEPVFFYKKESFEEFAKASTGTDEPNKQTLQNLKKEKGIKPKIKYTIRNIMNINSKPATEFISRLALLAGYTTEAEPFIKKVENALGGAEGALDALLKASGAPQGTVGK